MKQEMLIKSLEQLLDHLHMMPDSPSDKMMKSMVGDLEEEKEAAPKKPEVKVVEMKAKLPEMVVEKEEEEDEKPEVKVEIEKEVKPKGLFSMLGEDDPDMDEYHAKKKKAMEAYKALKG